MASGTSTPDWITAAAVATTISTLVSGGLTYYWEQRKLNRSERSAAYAAFLDTFSKRWRAFADRDGAARTIRRLNAGGTPDPGELTRVEAAQDAADARATELRDELYEAYTRIQILSCQAVVEAALDLVRISDDRNRAFRDPDRWKSPPNDARSRALAEFVKQARTDLAVKVLNTDRLRKDTAKLDAPWWAGGEEGAG